MVICIIGPCKSGKTLLLKRLQDNSFEHIKDFFSVPPTVQTTGTNVLRLTKKTDQNEEIEHVLQEIGGEIIELCLDFIGKCTKIVYVLDSSELSQLSFNFKYLMKILTSNSVYKKPILIVLNKTDLHSTLQADELEEMLFLDKLKNEFQHNSLSVIQSSCLTGSGLKEIYNWITS